MRHKRWIENCHDMTDERVLRRIAAAYFALITFLDENIAEVMRVAEELGLLATTRIIYTSDHGELFGSQGLLGKSSLYEGSVGVPLILSGPDILENHVVSTLVSHVDLFPTVVDGVGGRMTRDDVDLPGRSLFDIVDRREPLRAAFAEYHAQSSKAGQFMLRDGHLKLIYHVGMPAQLFDLSVDPDEIHDLVEEGSDSGRVHALELKLRAICDPEQVDVRAKSDQRLMAERWGGPAKLQSEEFILFTPPPGVRARTHGRLGVTSLYEFPMPPRARRSNGAGVAASAQSGRFWPSKEWRARRDSNSRPSELKSDALSS